MVGQSSNGFSLMVAVSLAAALLAPAWAWGATAEAAAAAPHVLVGSNVGSISKLTSLGAKPDLSTFWVGIWSKKTWSSVDNQLNSAKSAGVMPMIQWYYWGDDISPSCIENGCWSSLHNGWKSKGDWNSMAETLAKKIRGVMGNRPVYVVLETEFNKQGVATYEPMDGYLAAQAQIFRTHAPNAKLILGFGNWGSKDYKNFDRAMAKVDYLGTQELLGSTRDSDTAYLTGVERLLKAADFLNGNFGKPVFITDTGFSSYPEPKYAGYQERVVKDMFSRMEDLRQKGVVAWMYRSVHDNPKMDTANYYGMAERHWGFIRADGSWKPAMGDYLAGVKAMKAARSAPTAMPSTIEAESFDRATTGKSVADSKASGGKAWLLWGNGYIEEDAKTTVAGDYTFTIKARGTPAAGESPMMVLTLGGQELGRWRVNAQTEYWSYSTTATLASNQAEKLRIHFTNDHYEQATGADRNLQVDLVRVTAVSIAAPSTSGSREAEDMRHRSVGARYTDAKASGNAGWNLWSNGHVRDTITVERAGRYDVTVFAKADLGGQSYPRMVVRVDGAQVGAFDVRTEDAYWTYTVSRWLSEGDHEIRVEFVNDWSDPGKGIDRNLRLDRVSWKATS